MRVWIVVVVLVLILGMSAQAAQNTGLAAKWDFSEGKGQVLHDSSGNGNDGKIFGATWVKVGKTYALRFDGSDDYVDCGNGPSLAITGPITLQAWVMPTAANTREPGIAGQNWESYALTYYGNAWFYINGGGNGMDAPLKINNWTHVTATFDGTTIRTYANGVEAKSTPSKFPNMPKGKLFTIGCIVGNPDSVDTALRNTGFFPGMVSGVRVYNRVLDARAVMESYNENAANMGLQPIDYNRLGRLSLEAFFYPEHAVLSVNSRWALPLPQGATVHAQLARVGGEVLQTKPIDPNLPRNEAEADFPLTGLAAGQYELRALIRTASGDTGIERVGFKLPYVAPRPLPAPGSRKVAALPAPVLTPAYRVAVQPGGGFTVSFKGKTYPVESSYSYPNGGYNKLVGKKDAGDGAWKISTRKLDDKHYTVAAKGKYYSIDRRIELQPTRVIVKDTIRNLSPEAVGILFSNRINTTGLKDPSAAMMSNPTIFVSAEGCGMGLIALDDLYQLQQQAAFSDGIAEVRTDNFGLDKGGSYTFEWAVYPTATTDYYDFISQVRKDEGINRRVEGVLFMMDWRNPPDGEHKLAALVDPKYILSQPDAHPEDDPGVSIEGYEFTEYPKYMEKSKYVIDKTREWFPDAKVGFHIAHGLYCTNRPKELFPDSLSLDSNGSQFHYGPNTLEYYGKYMPKARFDDGWRWWIFYPTMENSFGKAMLERTEYMMDRMGATAMWADGYICGYTPGYYSYDKWDGLSVTIDSKTKLITEKKNCVPYTALPVLKKVIRVISEKGGVLISNDIPGPRSLWKEDMLTSNETGGGDARPIGWLHLGRSVTPLGNPEVIRNERDIYRDALAKLDLGALYFYYGGRDYITHPTLIQEMYPITLDSIHSGVVRGKERIVTKKPGVYGWEGDRSLHTVYKYDARGVLTNDDSLTTVDKAGVRTDLKLGKDESAAIAKIPVNITSASPVNVSVQRYDSGGMVLNFNGRGNAVLSITRGEFPIKAGTVYAVTGAAKATVKADSKGVLSIPLVLNGPSRIDVQRASR